MEEYLHKIYFDPSHPASYTSPEKLYKWCKEEGKYPVTRKKIKEWFSGVEAYTLHRTVQRRFPRNKVYVPKPGIQWDCDLIHMVDYSNQNDGIKYILICIDIFSRYVWLRGTKSKTPKDIIQAFKDIFNTTEKPLRLRTDKGKEFTNKECQRFLKSRNIVHMLAQNTETKANYAERAIKTLKMRIQRFFTHKQTHRYIDKLQTFANSYNNTYHRSIKTTPAKVNNDNEGQVWFTQYVEPLLVQTKPTNRKKIYHTGDLVRISHIRKTFEREYDTHWTGELFRIVQEVTNNNIPMYKLKDYSGENVQGLFYAKELQKVTVDEDQPYKIEKIIKTRQRKGSKQYYVKWLYWPDMYNSWVDETEVSDI